MILISGGDFINNPKMEMSDVDERQHLHLNKPLASL